MLEKLKTLGIFALLALMVLLLYGNLTLGMETDPWGLLGSGEQTAAELTAGDRWPVEPTLLALGREGQFYVPLTGEEWQLVSGQTAPLLTEAVGSMAEPAPLDGATAARWLAGDCLLVGFEAAQPLSALRIWSEAGGLEQDFPVERLLLCLEGGRVVAGLYDGTADLWYRADTAAGPQQLLTLRERYARANAALAGPDSDLAPDCMVLQETGPLPVYRVELPDYAAGGELPRSVLSAFGINGYLAKVYREQSTGDTVYVENYSSVRITAEGELIFTASAGQGILLDTPSDAAAAAGVLALARQVWDRLGAGGTLTLAGVTAAEDGSRLLTFDLLLGGRPVSADYGYAVTARCQAGVITTVRMQPRGFVPTGDTAQALAFRYGQMLLEGRTGASLSLCYQQGADGLLAPALRVED